MNNLLKKTGSGFLWIFLSKLLLQFVKIFFLVYLARLIDPSEFGKAALVIVFYSIIGGFFQFLYYNIILQNKLSQKIISVAIVFSLIISSLIITFCFGLNKIMQTYFQDSAYSIFGEVPTYYFFFTYLVGLDIVFKGILFKNLHFKYIAFSETFSNIIGVGILSLLVALFFTQSYHAILIGVIATYFLNILLAQYKEKVHFKTFSTLDFKILLNQSVTITMNSIVNNFAINGDYLIINNFLGPLSLGLYSKAYELISKPINLIGNTYRNVSFSSISNDKPNSKIIGQMVNKMTYLLSLVCFPMSVVIFIVSEDIISLILGDSWDVTGQIIGVLSFIIFFRIGYKKFMALLQSKEKFNWVLLLNIIYAVNIVLGSYLLYPNGLLFISSWVVISCAIHYLLCFLFARRIFKINAYGVLLEFLPGLIFASLFFLIHKFLLEEFFNQYISLIISFILVLIIFLLFEKIFPSFIKILRIKNYLKNEN